MKIDRSTWKVFYADGSSFTNEDGLPEQAPKCGVLAVVFYNLDNRREIATSKNYYIYDETPIFKDEPWGTWFAADDAGYWQYMMRPGKKIVLFGCTVHDFIWRRELGKITAEFPDALPNNVKLPEPR